MEADIDPGKVNIMRKFAIALLLALAPSTFAQTAAPDVTGKWTVVSSIAGNESTSTCTFAQTGSDMSGSCVSEQGTVKITGKVEGTSVSWSYNSDYNGTALTLRYKGKLADGKITGEASVDPFGVSGDFTATPVK